MAGRRREVKHCLPSPRRLQTNNPPDARGLHPASRSQLRLPSVIGWRRYRGSFRELNVGLKGGKYQRCRRKKSRVCRLLSMRPKSLHEDPVSTKVRAATRGGRATAFGGHYTSCLFISLASCADSQTRLLPFSPFNIERLEIEGRCVNP